MQPNRTRRQTGNMLIAFFIGLLSFFLINSIFHRLDLAANDALFKIRGPIEGQNPVVIVAIDDPSFSATLLRWPWPRDYLARIVNQITSGNPRAIAIDLLLSEESTEVADSALADAIVNAGNVVVVQRLSFQIQSSFTAITLERPIPQIEESVAASGLTNFAPDSDGVVRRLLAYEIHSGQTYYSWALELVRLYLDESEFTILNPDQVQVGGKFIQLEDQYIRVNYQGEAGTIPYYSAYQVADGTVDPEVFQGKIVILGVTTPTLHDEYGTPFSIARPMPGAEINAHAINTILNTYYIRQTAGLGSLFLHIFVAVLSMWITLNLRPLGGLLTNGLLIVILIILAAAIFANLNMFIPFAGPILAISLTYIIGTSIQLIQEQRNRVHIRGLFERYVAPAAIDHMLTSPDEFLAGQRREITVLFSDIRGFTTLSEQMPPSEVVEILNEYLSEMTEIIFRYEGTIDKFEGDAILAFFNAPLKVRDHPEKAVACAMAMIERLAKLETHWEATGREPLRIGIGIHTGDAFVGNVGSARRMDYTIIGDTVNLASRIQDMTKGLDMPILFSGQTNQALSADISSFYVTTSNVRGREKPVDIYTIEGMQGSMTTLRTR